MPSFAITSAEQLADFVIPLTQEMAVEVITYAQSHDNACCAAVYYLSGNRDKPRRESLLVTVLLEADGKPFGFCYLTEYHPRSQGRAHLIYRTELYIHD